MSLIKQITLNCIRREEYLKSFQLVVNVLMLKESAVMTIYFINLIKDPSICALIQSDYNVLLILVSECLTECVFVVGRCYKIRIVVIPWPVIAL